MSGGRVWDHLVIPEPELRFSSTQAGYRSINPLEGLLQWGPYDSSLGGYLRPNPIKLAVVTTSQGFPSISRHLQRLRQGAPFGGQHEYIRAYPGFSAVYRTNLEFPQSPADPFAIVLPSRDIERAQAAPSPHQAFFELVSRALGELYTRRHEFHVLVFHVPDELAEFRVATVGESAFDLHDAVKSHLARANIKAQFIEDRSIRKRSGAEVAWWLSLAVYAKANGIPWKLASVPQQTAYIGLAYGIKSGETQQRVVMGCSQVFDEHGEGLRFILHEVENPVWRRLRGRDNPFLSRDDARSLFWRVRDLYQSALGHRPRRIVVHKTVFFTPDEVDGIGEAFSGIDQVDLLQVEQDTSLRALAYDPPSQRAPDPVASRFPVKRGTVLPLDERTFALWTQGDVIGKWGTGYPHYYPEKRAIPSPLVIRRFWGNSTMEELAHEVLQLTKMDWNTLGLYCRLPVTIAYSQRIAQIAKEIPDIAPFGMDFRFFM